MTRWVRAVSGAALVAGSIGGLVGVVGVPDLVEVAGAAPTPSCSGGTCTVTFTYTGTEQSFAVPATVTHATITADGAQGGAGTTTGGKGAHVRAYGFRVAPGGTLHIVVGGEGTSSNGSGGGGGGSFVWTTATPSQTDLLIAAGGGGGGGSRGSQGGAGSATTGRTGGGVGGKGSTGGAGGGGLSGDGGKGSFSYTLGGKSLENGAAGGAGDTYGSGGFGGGGAGAIGGGGGGGYNGGHGGSTGGGGAGGDSYFASSAKGESGTNGARSGNGEVVISYSTPTVLYVRAGSDGTTCTSATTGTAAGDACGQIQPAVTKAEPLTGKTVIITVGQGSYTGGITITAEGLSSLTIRGAGTSTTKLTGGGTVRDFEITGGTVTVEGFSISGGTAGSGGGVYNTGTATFTRDTFSGDTATGADGGAFYNANTASATLTDDTFSGDTAKYDGGAVANTGSTSGPAVVTITDDTFIGDTAHNGGGGAFSNIGVGSEASAIATLTDDTFSGDTGNHSLGGTAAGAIYNGTATATLTASIFDGSSCYNTSGSLSATYDVTTTASCNFGSTGDETVTATELDLTTTLGTNTAPAAPKTLAIGLTSAALDMVPSSLCQSSITLANGGSFELNVDERGEPRPGNVTQTFCDAGAYELQAYPPAFTSPGVAKFPHRVDTTFTITTSGSPAATVTERGNLPTGLTFTTNGNGTATISGTPSPRDKRSYSIRLTATNGVSPPAVQRLTIDIGTRPVY